MIYTRTGDDGTSGLFAKGKRADKTDIIFQALGTVDELNSLLGVCYAKSHLLTQPQSNNISLTTILRQVQENLFIVQAQLAGSDKFVSAEQVKAMEDTIAKIELCITNPKAFVIAGSNELSAFLDLARSVARRAERCVLALDSAQAISVDSRIYLNRLSSLLYVLARYAATLTGGEETNPKY